jgi:hypothetical protein
MLPLNRSKVKFGLVLGQYWIRLSPSFILTNDKIFCDFKTNRKILFYFDSTNKKRMGVLFNRSDIISKNQNRMLAK